jgi:hypothetical protein
MQLFFHGATSFTIHSLYSIIGHYVLRPNGPSSGVQVVMVKDSAAHCNTVIFPPSVVASVILVMWVAISFLVSFGCPWFAFL